MAIDCLFCSFAGVAFFMAIRWAAPMVTKRVRAPLTASALGVLAWTPVNTPSQASLNLIVDHPTAPTPSHRQGPGIKTKGMYRASLPEIRHCAVSLVIYRQRDV